MRPLKGVYPDALHRADHQALIDAINRLEAIASSLFTVVYFTVATAGTEVAVSHDLGAVPASFVQVRNLERMTDKKPTGTGTVAAGTTGWSSTVVYLKADAAGTYAAIIRM
jgi:hypothetical protein